ncbi:MAG: sodium/solute symporter [Ignavibacteriaceae bacterium]|nr:sodium/solute symporter [Ignavibacteriaceae bacterium]
MPGTFTYIDAFFIILYLIVALSIGFYYSKKNGESYQVYFLAGRNIGWFAIGISIFATNISSEHFIGLAGAGSVRGLAVGQFELMAIFTLLFAGWFLSPVFLKTGVYTVPEFLELNFDIRIRKFFAAFSILSYILTKILVSLFAAGLLFYNIFGLNIYASSIMIVLITGLYSVTGGANSVIRTQTFQGIVLIIGATILSVSGFIAVGGFEGLYTKLNGDFFTMFKSAGDKDYPWTGIVFGAPVIAFWYWCTDQYIVQRILSARSVDDARRGSLLAASLKVLPIFILVLPGLFAAVLYPESKGDGAYSALLNGNVVPAGLKGIVIAGLLAAIMSSLAGAFNSIAVLFTNDYYKLKHPEASERKLVLVGRLSTMAAVVVAILIVPMVKLISSQLYLFLQSAQSFVSPQITAVFLFGLFSRKMSSGTAIKTLAVTEFIGVGRLILEMATHNGIAPGAFFAWVLSINFLHFSIFLFLLSVSMIVVLNFRNSRETNKFAIMLRVTFREILTELKGDIKELRHITRLSPSFVLSAIILLMIIGLWSIWH